MNDLKRIVVAIGCNSYEATDTLPCLGAAERDADGVYQQLTARGGDYDLPHSALLLSPTLAEVSGALAALPFGADDVESITIYFAGHGWSKSGTFYLCVRDSDPSRLSTSSLSVLALLSVIAELKPRQANLIIDACESGGALIDSASILRADALGLHSTSSLGIAFLAACGASQEAFETDEGGMLTSLVLQYLRGEKVLQTTRPYLDLIDLGRRISAEMLEVGDVQIPVTWGVNLTGEGRFAPNPSFQDMSGGGGIPMPGSTLLGESASAATTEVLRAHALGLWNEHQRVETSLDVESLLATLRRLTRELTDNPAELQSLVRGLSTSLRASAAKSRDPFAEPIVLAACAIQLLQLHGVVDTSRLASELIDEFLEALSLTRRTLREQLNEDRFALLSDRHGIANLFFLPVRVSRILGWLAVGIRLSSRDHHRRADVIEETNAILNLIVAENVTALSTVSDEQAPYLLILSSVLTEVGWHTLNELVLSCYYCSIIECRGAVARPAATGEDAFHYTMALGLHPESIEHSLRASPSQLLAVLLFCGARAELDDVWDLDLALLDHQEGYVFLPSNYQSFAQTTVETGTNKVLSVGRNVFCLHDVREFELSAVRPDLEEATKDLDVTSSALALFAALLMPDRVPLHMLDTHAVLVPGDE